MANAKSVLAILDDCSAARKWSGDVDALGTQTCI